LHGCPVLAGVDITVSTMEALRLSIRLKQAKDFAQPSRLQGPQLNWVLSQITQSSDV